MKDATRAGLAILVILTVAAPIGTQLLHLFGVSLDAFMVAGGGVLAWMGFSMISRHFSNVRLENRDRHTNATCNRVLVLGGDAVDAS